VQVVDDSKGTRKNTVKSAGMKRAAGDSSANTPSKRQKSTPSTSDNTIVRKDIEPSWVADPDQVFRFMDLPGGQLSSYVSKPEKH
jgi:hypothetical protein